VHGHLSAGANLSVLVSLKVSGVVMISQPAADLRKRGRGRHDPQRMA